MVCLPDSSSQCHIRLLERFGVQAIVRRACVAGRTLGRGRASGVIAAQAAGTGDGRRENAFGLGVLVNPALRGIVETEHGALLEKGIPLGSLEAPANEAVTQ